MTIRYQVRYHDDRGTLLQVFGAADIVRLEYAFSENEVGGLELTISALDSLRWDMSMWRVDRLLIVERDMGAGFVVDGERAWLLQDWEYKRDANNNLTITLIAFDGNHLLTRRIVAYNKESAQALMDDYGDDIMKAIVRQNLGPDCTDTARIMSGVTVQADTSKAPQFIRDMARGNIFTELQKTAEESLYNGTYLVFDMVMTTPGNWQFRTYTGQRGVNHGQNSKSVRRVELQLPTLKRTHKDEKNYVYAGSSGKGEAKTVQAAYKKSWINAGRWNRKELWVDARNTKTATTTLSEAKAALYENRPKIILTGRIAESDGLRYGIDYKYGDIVVASWLYTFDCHVTAVHITYANGVETIDNRVRGEL